MAHATAQDRDSRPRRRFLLAHNPVSGPRGSQRLVERVVAELQRRGAEVEVRPTRGMPVDADMARTAAAGNRFDAIVAAGGDGTLRAIATGLVGRALPLGLVPLGTGNTMACELGLTRRAGRLADLLMSGPVRPILPGLANGAPFLLMASAGVDARILARLNLALKRHAGKLAYLPPTLTALTRRLDSFPVVIDGAETRCSWAIVTRARHYGGAFVVAPRQDLAGDRFTAVLVRTESRLELARVLLSAAAGRLDTCPLLEMRPCRSVRIGGDVPVQIDGEEAGRAPLDVVMGKAPVRLIAP